MEKFIINLSNSWIIGCSILTYGIISSSYLRGLGNIPLIHMKYKYKLELKQAENNADYTDKIKNEEKKISYYWNQYTVVYLLGISGLTFGALRLNKQN